MIAPALEGVAVCLALLAIVCAVEGRKRKREGLGCLALVLGSLAFWAGVGCVVTTWMGV